MFENMKENNKIIELSNNREEDIIKEEIIKGIEKQEFILHYQPKVDIKTNIIVGSEALIRWNHSEKGLIYPDEFIPIAEKYELIKDIDKLVLDMVCNQIKEWRKKNIHILSVAVNISSNQINDKSFIEYIKHILNESKVNPSLINLEITESCKMNNFYYVKKNLKEIKKLGIKISLDDFCVEYSCLNYLRKIDVDVIKIDKSFVDEMVQNEFNYTVVKSIIDIAKSLNIHVVAEGVERKEQLEILKNLKCDEYQGYLCSKAVTAKEFEYLLRKD